MNRNRVIFVIAWILSLLGISFFGGALSYGVFALLTAVPVVSLLYLLCVFAFFRIYQEVDSRWLVAGHAVPFFFTLMNEYFFGFAGIRVRLFSSFSTISGLDDGIEYELLPRTGIKKRTTLVCKYRGEYEVGIKQIEIQDYFRLFRLTYKNRETLRVVVKPELISLETLKSVDIANLMPRETEFRASHPDVLVRSYEAGDDVRLINWKVSASVGQLMIRRQTGEEQEGVCILLGTFRSCSDPLVYLPAENKMLETVLALSLYLVKKNIPSKVLYMAGELSEKNVSGLDRFDTFYDAVSGISFREDMTEKELLEMSAGYTGLFSSRAVFIILQSWSGEALNLVRMLNGNNVSAVVYIIGEGAGEKNPESGMPRAEVHYFSPHADLREVL